MENNTQNTTNNAPMNSMQTKKSHKLFWIIGIGVVIILLIALGTRNSESNNKNTAPTSEQVSSSAETEQNTNNASKQNTGSASDNAAPADTSSGKLGDYAVSILDAKKVNDYEGNPAIIVNFDYTNNSNDSQMFSTSVTCIAYQNGVQLSDAFILDGSYDSESSLKKIKPGASLKTQHAYVLDDPSAPVTVEVTEWISLSDKKLTKEFTF